MAFSQMEKERIRHGLGFIFRIHGKLIGLLNPWDLMQTELLDQDENCINWSAYCQWKS